ncbi:MAG: sigma 54-interacting transcriptional regulator [Cyclobacteriaceae bacterium]
MGKPSIQTVGELKKTDYISKSIKDEIRDNLIASLQSGETIFHDIQGFENTVIPQLEAALLAKHNMLFLGLRGQAKTRMARLMVRLLDEYIPVIAGTELGDDPYQPISKEAYDLLAEHVDKTPIDWVHRDERYVEKLATPDVSVADLIGDVDPIKAATQKLTYADERVIHYGMIPRAHRSIFVINELPDLQARIQVALFNILQEGDIQIRGFNVRLPVDVQFVFTANPEDYTNRGSIVTPLKDRIESQILTHYPTTLEISKTITHQEAKIDAAVEKSIPKNTLIDNLIEQIAFEARESEYVDQKSGVSARLTIAAYELLYAVTQRRLLKNGEKTSYFRISDLVGVIPAINGKIELVYEGEQEGSHNVSLFLLGKAIRKEFERLFPNPEKSKKVKEGGFDPYAPIIAWFNKGNSIDLLQDTSKKTYKKALHEVDGLEALIDFVFKGIAEDEKLLMMEFALHGLAEFSQISKQAIDSGSKFKDLVGSMFNMDFEQGEEELY